ncbi:acyltransferase [Bradyrhizobium sp. BRP22]|uniref:acyltransferase family protein n=1 Tax=Bradyrhizobium sp. BRP22 TaxID=2793821 RepID=UPI001CD30DDD|nr:acyltransferase [Bradyrhizobium sp. BRP22]MCA1457931.1 acyltransferase [Bradyrhizobium sp. BRP22]
MAGQTSSGTNRFEALDAMRGICALLVVLFHIPVYHALKSTQPFVNLQFCVDMFFALSGFVLCHSYGQRLNQAGDGIRFVAMRFARLWPLHMVMLALFVMIEVGKIVFMRTDGSFSLDSVPFGDGHTLYEVVTNILFLQSFNLHGGLTWNGPAWSAAVEFYVSILFAVIVVLFPRRRREIFLGLCLAAGIHLYERSPGSLFVSSDWGMLRAMFSFFAGCLVYDLRLYSNGRLDMPNILEVSCAVLFAVFVVVTPSSGPQYLFPLLAAVVICVFSFDQGKISAMLRSPMLQKLGLWSYSIYMIHTFIFQIMRSAASFLGHKLHLELVAWHNDDKLVVLGTPEMAVVAALVLSVVLVVPVAALTYRWIEKPAMNVARHALSTTTRGEMPLGTAPATGFGAAVWRQFSAGAIRTAAGFRAVRLP